MSTELLTLNLSGRRYRIVENGVEYIVAPMTMIVEGVLPGNRGPLFYPFKEMSRNVGAWNRVPLTLGHPYDPVTNAPLSAGDDGVAERQHIGAVRRSHVANRKLKGEAWFDVEKLRSLNTALLNSLEEGETLELSTGLYTDNEERSGTFNGREFTHVARNYRPDHVAVLLDQRGACSVEDGCGVHNEYVVNPFKNDAQRRACYAADDLDWDCKEWDTHNDANFVSEQQRRFLWSQEPDIAEAWAHGEHTAEAGHRMPSGPGPDVKGPAAEKARERAAKRRTHNMTLFDRFMSLLVRNAEQEMPAVVKPKKQPKEEPAAASGSAEAGTRQQRQQQPNKPVQTTANAKKCPRCGGEMDEDGECEDCGYVENQGRHPKTGQYQGSPHAAAKRGFAVGGVEEDDPERATDDLEVGPGGTSVGNERSDAARDAAAASRKARGASVGAGGFSKYKRAAFDSANEAQDEANSGNHQAAMEAHKDAAESHRKAADYEMRAQTGSKATADRHLAAAHVHDDAADAHKAVGKFSSGTQNAYDPHGATKQAAAASLFTDHSGAVDHSMGAVESSRDGDSDAAKGSHMMAARAHERAATDARDNDDDAAAAGHDQAAALHRKAASIHSLRRADNVWTDEAREAAKAARAATKTAHAKTKELGTPFSYADRSKGPTPEESGHEASKDAKSSAFHSKQDHEGGAAHYHEAAAKEHAQAAEHFERTVAQSGTQQRKDRYQEPADLHKAAAEAHTAAAKAIRGNMATQNKDFGSDAERRAAFAQMTEAGTLQSGPTSEAHEASAKAERTGSASAHKNAAEAHREASSHHEGSNKELSQYHASAAKYHAAKAGKAGKVENMSRGDLLKVLTANCTCDSDKQALNMLSDAALRRLMLNTSQTSGDGSDSVQSGGAEDDEDNVGEPEKPKFKKKTMNQWLAEMPPEARSVWNTAAKYAGAEKQRLVAQLTANLEEPRRARAVATLNGKTVEQLQELMSLMPTSNVEELPVANFMGLGGGPAYNAGEPVGREQHILQLPTMNEAS